MAAADPELRTRILGNARAAMREQLLNRIDPHRLLPAEEAAAAVDQAWREQLAANGRLGATKAAANAAALRNIRDTRDQLITDLENHRAHVCAGIDTLLEQLRAIGAGR